MTHPHPVTCLICSFYSDSVFPTGKSREPHLRCTMQKSRNNPIVHHKNHVICTHKKLKRRTEFRHSLGMEYINDFAMLKALRGANFPDQPLSTHSKLYNRRRGDPLESLPHEVLWVSFAISLRDHLPTSCDFVHTPLESPLRPAHFWQNSAQ